MGVIRVVEENPFNEFLKGISPMADAWANRYIQRDLEKRENELFADMDRLREGDFNNGQAKEPGFSFQSSPLPIDAMERERNLDRRPAGNFLLNSNTKPQWSFDSARTPDPAIGGLKLNANPEVAGSTPVSRFHVNQGLNQSRAMVSPSAAISERDALKAKILKNGGRLYGGNQIRQMLNEAEYQNEVKALQMKIPSLSQEELWDALIRLDLMGNQGRLVPQMITARQPSFTTHVAQLDDKFAVVRTQPNRSEEPMISYYPYK